MLKYKGEWHSMKEIVALGLAGRKRDRGGKPSEEWWVIPWLTFVHMVRQHGVLVPSVWAEAKDLCTAWNERYSDPGKNSVREKTDFLLTSGLFLECSDKRTCMRRIVPFDIKISPNKHAVMASIIVSTWSYAKNALGRPGHAVITPGDCDVRLGFTSKGFGPGLVRSAPGMLNF